MVNVVLEIETGSLELELYVDKAPLSAGSFLAHCDQGLYEGASFYRAVRHDNDNGNPKVEVIQGGLVDIDPIEGLSRSTSGKGLPPVAHESTQETGIKHKDGTLSLARPQDSTGSGHTFSICVGDQPALDYGKERYTDKKGFAAFGKVTKGMDLVRQIQQMDTSGLTTVAYYKNQILVNPVKIIRAYRKN